MRTGALRARSHPVIAEQNIDAMDPAQLRELTARLLAEVKHKDALIEKLTHENAVLKRLKRIANSVGLALGVGGARTGSRAGFCRTQCGTNSVNELSRVRPL